MNEIRTPSRRVRAWCAVAAAILWTSAAASSASAAERMYFPAVDNVADLLVQKINAETVRVDMSAWYLTEHAISIALINKYRSGVPVRLIGDRGAIFEIDANTRREFYWLASQGLPIRLRFNPTWYPEIAHWKATIFVGQNLVSFGSANYTPFELAPVSSTNYKDETVLFSDDPALVNAFKTKFDRLWNDTTTEPQSVAGAPPYFKNWDDACASEPTGNCRDYRTLYPNPAPMAISTARLEPNHPMPPDMVWSQGPEFNTRLVQEINNEKSLVRFVIYRLTVNDITNALLNKARSGVPVQLIIEPNEYRNRRWPEFWLTQANIDKLWAAGIPIKQRAHMGLTHMKTLVTSAYATNASANYAAGWQRDANYFVPAATRPGIYGAIRDRVARMWNDSTDFVPFRPLPPDAPVLGSPSSGTTGASTSATLVWNRAAFAVSYDVYLGTSSSNLSHVANVPAQLVNNPPTTYSWTATLQSGTTYYWRVVSRTNATVVDPSLVAASPTWSFTTGGSPPPSSIPSPWTTRDVGAVGLSGSAAYASGQFTVRGAGADIWGTADSFRYVYQSASGDVQIVARVTGIENTHQWAKAGVMLRESLSADAAHVMLNVTPTGTTEFMKRTSAGASSVGLANASQSPPVWLKLSRSGSTVSAFVSANGSTWKSVGSTGVSMPASGTVGLVVTSHDTGTLNTSTFDNVDVTAASAPPPDATDVVIYASDVPSSALHGAWKKASDATSPNGIKLLTPDNGLVVADAPLASPTHYVDVTFTAQANTPYRLWLRLRALNDSKYNDSIWVQFSDARANGTTVYRTGTTAGLNVNLATDPGAGSLDRWGWQNSAYWLSQPTTVTFPTTGARTLRIQVREDGVQIDQIVLSSATYLNQPPGSVTNDGTVVPKP
jgi:hypothetical protein